MQEKLHNLKGLNLRDSLLVKSSLYASDCLNVNKNSQGDIVKRFGHDAIADITDAIDLIHYEEKNYLLAVVPEGLRRWDGSSWINIPSEGLPVNYSIPLSYTEIKGILYLADPSGSNELYKFDGLSFFRAGLPKPVISSSGGSSGITYYYRIWFGYEDLANGVEIKGDYFQTEKLKSDVVFSVETTKGTAFKKNIYAVVAWSANETFGYRMVGTSKSDSFGYAWSIDGIANTSEIVSMNNAGISTDNQDMEDWYDATVLKGLPPKASYVTAYNTGLVAGNVEPTSLNVRNGITKSTFYFSDFGVGSSAETFGPFDYQTIGKTDEGHITGLYGSSDYLIVFKKRAIYFVYGVLTGKSYRIERISSGDIGCISHRSIGEFDKGVFFLGLKGIYAIVNASAPNEVSDVIQPIFTEDKTGLIFEQARATLDYKRELLLMFIPATDPANSITVVYDYYHQDWFPWKGIDASRGIVHHDNTLFHVGSTRLFKQSYKYSDAGSPISAYYQTGFVHADIPAFKKKFIQARVFSIIEQKWTAIINVFSNWSSLPKKLSDTSFSKDDIYKDIHLDSKNADSLCIRIENNKLDDPLHITGIEIEFEAVQKRMKQ